MVFSSSLPHHVLLLNVVSIHEVLPITRKVMKKKRSFSAQKPFRKRLVGQVLVMFCGPLFELHRLDGLRMLLFFCRSNFVESSTYHNLISMLCWRVLDICDIHPYSVFLLFCFVVFCFFFQDGYYLFSQCHRDSWIWPSGSRVFYRRASIPIICQYNRQIPKSHFADATHIDPNTKQKDGLQSYFFSSLYRRKNTYNYEIDTPPKINIEPENDGLEDDFPFPRVEHLRFHVVIFWGVNWIKVDFRHATWSLTFDLRTI